MRRALLLAMLGAMSAVMAAGQTVGDKYHVLKVEKFDIEKGVELPPEAFATLQDELPKQLTESQKFTAVLSADKMPEGTEPALCLDGVVTGFDAGSRAKRYFGGFGAGSARIFAHVRYHDCGSGELVIEEEMTGTMQGGVFGGEAKNVSKEFAKTVTTTTRMVLMKNIPAHATKVEARPATDSKDQKVVAITKDDVMAGEQQLNQLAAEGYRLVRLRPTGGDSAEVTLEKLADPSQRFEYRVPRTKLISNLEKDVNKLARDGFRLVPHTICGMRNFAVIAERPVGTTSGYYQYRIEMAVLLSNAEKNVREFQAQGFELVDAANLFGPYIVVMEKTNAPKAASGAQ